MNIEIPKNARIIIIEGIAGSGKDTFQAILKEKLSDKLVYNYSEEEVLFSWKHAGIPGIMKLRIEFMKIFINYMEQVLNDEPEAIFLLNRFHLSTYKAHISKDVKLRKEYDPILEHLKKLPVHIFILKLNPDEIEKRSMHAERPDTWKKHQQEMIKKEGFSNGTERYLDEQEIIIEAAREQGIPFSVIKL